MCLRKCTGFSTISVLWARVLSKTRTNAVAPALLSKGGNPEQYEFLVVDTGIAVPKLQFTLEGLSNLRDLSQCIDRPWRFGCRTHGLSMGTWGHRSLVCRLLSLAEGTISCFSKLGTLLGAFLLVSL